MKIDFPLKVFYDGGCPVCSVEMGHYRQIAEEGKLIFIDIDAPDFRPENYGRTLEEFMKEMHVMDASGRVFRGVDAFRALWKGLSVSIYGDLSALLGLPGVHLLARTGYRGFARLRRLLPRQERGCSSDRCHPGHRH